MDPVSILFAAYLDSILHPAAGGVPERLPSGVVTEYIQYRGTRVDFQHEGGKVKHPSVCASLRYDLRGYSACAETARDLFRELCVVLAESDHSEPHVVRMRDMYCDAAFSFEPPKASISPIAPPSGIERLRLRCNILTASALGSNDPALIAERNKVCGELAAMQARQGVRSAPP